MLFRSKAGNYRMKKDWTNLSATLNQIAKLEPHFITVWQHQAWNLSFNVSAEFDGYRDRYHWVIEGIKFLKRGVTLNRHEPRLVADVGWFIKQKIGYSDEAKQFRVLFREDDDFHADDEEFGGSRPPEFRDNFLVGKYWFRRAERLVDGGASLRKTAPLVFFSHRPMCQMSYAQFLEKDGVFGEKAKLAWKKAEQEWHEFGARGLPAGKGDTIRLNDEEMHLATIVELNAKLDEMGPGVREAIRKQKYRLLTDEQREAYETPPEKLTRETYYLSREAAAALNVTPDEVARRITGPDRKEARKMAKQIKEADKLARLIAADRGTINFVYWRMRAQMEQTDETRAARELIYKGNAAARKGYLPSAKDYYDAGLAKWRELLDREDFSFLVREANTVDDLIEIIDKYRLLLEMRDEPFPKDFILQDVLDSYDRRFTR